MELRAILFDTRSIQKYIFSSNQLKTNIGASYLVERVFYDVLLPAVEEVVGTGELDAVTWRQEKEPDWASMPQKARVAYIGGGNALILLRPDAGEEAAPEIVRRFSRRLLVECPGLQTGAAIGSLELAADGRWSDDDAKNRSGLVLKLKEQQNFAFPLTNVPYTGLTLSSDGTGEAANAYDAGLGRYLSQDAAQKLRVAVSGRKPAPAEEALREKLASVLSEEEKEGFLAHAAFPASLDDMGQKEAESYIAVVHIDGNNMGLQFSGLKTLTEYKNKSLEIYRSTIRAFAELVLNLEKEAPMDFLSQKRTDEGRFYLPLRPLILGGDDMTFVCAAKTAFAFTEFIMKALMEKGFDTCAGLAILPTAYPFFRGYEIAEQLCDCAKVRMRKLADTAKERPGKSADAADESLTPRKSCWLDFLRLHGEQAPTLEQIRRQEYRGALGSLQFGPYRIDGDGSDHYSFRKLRALAEGLRRKIPNNKLKELRSVLQHDEHAAKKYLEQLRHDGYRLPQVDGWEDYTGHLWQKRHAAMRTPFVEAIELLEFLPAGKRQAEDKEDA